MLDHDYLLAAARYIERNPVRAGLVKEPQQWPWSSAAAHLAGQDDRLVQVTPLLKNMPNWRSFLAEPDPKDLSDRERREGEKTRGRNGRREGQTIRQGDTTKRRRGAAGLANNKYQA